jgi:alpha-galactosidase
MAEEFSPEIEAQWIHSDLSAADLRVPEWKTASPVFINRQWSGEPAPPSRHAEVRILWSDQALHVRYVCRQTEPLVINPNPRTRAKTIGLWDRDVCEIFLAPEAVVPEHYFEFEAAPTGEWVDLGIKWKSKGRETDWNFNSGMTAAAHHESYQLLIGMRIPWSTESQAIHKPHQAELWRVNLFRCVGVGNDRYLAWQPTLTAEPNFHVPEAFGWLRFG